MSLNYFVVYLPADTVCGVSNCVLINEYICNSQRVKEILTGLNRVTVCRAKLHIQLDPTIVLYIHRILLIESEALCIILNEFSIKACCTSLMSSNLLLASCSYSNVRVDEGIGAVFLQPDAIPVANQDKISIYTYTGPQHRSHFQISITSSN